jgi:hypothetical protein
VVLRDLPPLRTRGLTTEIFCIFVALLALSACPSLSSSSDLAENCSRNYNETCRPSTTGPVFAWPTLPKSAPGASSELCAGRTVMGSTGV